jgi:hypothetical protein
MSFIITQDDQPLKVQLSFSSPLRIEVAQIKPQSTYRAIVEWEIENIIVKGENMSSTMQAGTSAEATVKWVDQYGNAARVDGATEWASSDDTIATVESTPGPPENRAKVSSVGAIGPVQIQATADADLSGQGTRRITAVLDLVIIGGEASAGEIELTAGAQTEPVKGRKK